MTASTWIARAKDRIEAERPEAPRAQRKWVGIDFSDEHGAQRARRLLPLLVFALIAALGVSALRIDLIRIRYAMADVLAEEKALIEEQRSLIVKRRQLRDPVELAIQARARGFRPLSAALSIPDPMPNTIAATASTSELPSVSARPPTGRTRSAWR